MPVTLAITGELSDVSITVPTNGKQNCKILVPKTGAYVDVSFFSTFDINATEVLNPYPAIALDEIILFEGWVISQQKKKIIWIFIFYRSLRRPVKDISTLPEKYIPIQPITISLLN